MAIDTASVLTDPWWRSHLRHHVERSLERQRQDKGLEGEALTQRRAAEAEKLRADLEVALVEAQWALDRPIEYKRVNDLTEAQFERRDYRASLVRLRRWMASTFEVGTPEGAQIYLTRCWGEAFVAYGNYGTVAVSHALELVKLKRKRARLSTAEDRIASIVSRRYGQETIFQRMIGEVMELDPGFARIVTPRTAYLLAVSEYVTPPPRDEDRLRQAEDRWRWRWRPEKLTPNGRLSPVTLSEAGETSTKEAVSSD